MALIDNKMWEDYVLHNLPFYFKEIIEDKSPKPIKVKISLQDKSAINWYFYGGVIKSPACN